MKKCISLLMCLVVSMSALTVVPNAAATNEGSNAPPHVYVPPTRSVDTSFEIDFGESEVWVFDFDNEGGLFHFNDEKVKVTFINASAGNPIVEVRLYELDGEEYVPITEDSEGYMQRLIEGSSADFSLPRGAEVWDYRIVFTCRTDMIGTFSVETHRQNT